MYLKASNTDLVEETYKNNLAKKLREFSPSQRRIRTQRNRPVGYALVKCVNAYLIYVMFSVVTGVEPYIIPPRAICTVDSCKFPASVVRDDIVTAECISELVQVLSQVSKTVILRGKRSMKSQLYKHKTYLVLACQLRHCTCEFPVSSDHC